MVCRFLMMRPLSLTLLRDAFYHEWMQQTKQFTAQALQANQTWSGKATESIAPISQQC